MAPLWLCAAFLFVLGICIGSFLNVVIWRLPRGESVRKPAGSYCPHCRRPIAWFDNIPVFSWLLLRARCRHCRGPISPRYPLVELASGLLFVGLLLAVYAGPWKLRADTGDWPDNWPGYVSALVLSAGLLAASVIDLEHFFIPLPVVWAGGLLAVALSAVFPGPWLPTASPPVAAWGLGGTGGLLIAAALLWAGVIPLSFPDHGEQAAPAEPVKPAKDKGGRSKKSKRSAQATDAKEPARPAEAAIGATVGARREVSKELLFLAPVLLGGLFWWRLTGPEGALGANWGRWCESAHLRGLGGSLFGLLVGGGVIWAVRIIGTLLAGREAMGLGDVHLLASAGALLGWAGATLTFFISPFFGVAVGLVQLARHGRRELPFGPYLSLAVLTVLLCYDRLAGWLGPPLTAIFVSP